jgi:hypothetical protein
MANGCDFHAGHPAAARFTAEAGQAYYFRTENYFWKETGVTNIKLGQLDSDEALLLMSKLGFSESKAKKIKPHLRSARAVALRCGLCYFRS